MTNCLKYSASLVCFFTLIQPHAKFTKDNPAGSKVYLGVVCPSQNARQLLLRYLPQGKIWLNDTPFDEPGLRAELVQIMTTRGRKLVWIAADERMSYGEVVSLINDLQHDTPDLMIGIATKSQIGPVDPLQLQGQRDRKGRSYPIMPQAPCLTESSEAPV